MTIELINANIVAAHLLVIPQKLRTAVETKAVREASKLIVGKFRENAPKESGALRKSLKFDVRKYRGGNVVVGLIGADFDFVGSVFRENKKNKRLSGKGSKLVFMRGNLMGGDRRRPAKYLHLVNYGTVGDRKTQAGKNRGGVDESSFPEGLRFRERTQEQAASQVQQILEDAIHEALQ